MADQVSEGDHDPACKNDSALDSKLGASDLPQMSEADRQRVVSLFQQHPKMWTDFRLVIDLFDHLQVDSWNYQKSRNLLMQLLVNHQTSRDFLTYDVVLSQFSVAVGAVDSLAKLYRQIFHEKGKGYVTELLPPFPDDETWCVYSIKTFFLALSCFGMEFRLCAAQSGFLDFVMDDLRHMQHLSSDALKNGNVYIESMGTLFNCCRHPEVVQLLRQKNVIVDVLPFMDKEIFVIKGLALITLAFLVEDCDLDVIQLDCETVQYFLDTTSASFTSQGRESEGWQTDAVVHGLSQFARNEVNRRHIVAQGGLRVLVPILDNGNQVQKEVAMDTLMALCLDPGNLHVFQTDRRLRQAVQQVERGGQETLRESAAAVLALMAQHPSTAESQKESTDSSECEFLRENSNAMAILDVGEVEYVLDQLETGSDEDTGSRSLREIFEAVLHMARDDNKKREIFARGGLHILTNHLEKVDAGDKVMVLNVIGTLASSAEYGEIIQSHRGLRKLTTALIQSDNAAASQAASRLQQAIKEITSSRGPSDPNRLNNDCKATP